MKQNRNLVAALAALSLAAWSCGGDDTPADDTGADTAETTDTGGDADTADVADTGAPDTDAPDTDAGTEDVIPDTAVPDSSSDPDTDADPDTATGIDRDALRDRAMGLMEPLPQSVDIDPQMAALGNALYHDPMLSGDGTISCASCHDIAEGGDDGLPASIGIDGQVGGISAPTVLNSSYNIAQFWDGRAATLEEQAEGPVANPIEMGADWEVVVADVAANAVYAEQFDALFDDGVTQDNITRAIADFERTLVTPNDDFDRFLRGDNEAMSELALEGLEVYLNVNCTMCHNGPALGGRLFFKLGLMRDYYALRGGEITEDDLGRYNVTGQEADRYVFKVPTLRNIARTGPYFHDGHEEDLGEAARTMALVQLNRELTDGEVEALEAFLRSLDGELPE